MALIEVAEGIPCPQTSTVSPEERRLQSDGTYGPLQLRTVELDERQLQPFTWTLSSDQAAIWKAWWRDTLIYGGAWFSAPETWPAVEGLVVKVRRFIGAPEWSYIGLGYWRVSAQVEVRGESELPTEPAAQVSRYRIKLDVRGGGFLIYASNYSADFPDAIGFDSERDAYVSVGSAGTISGAESPPMTAEFLNGGEAVGSAHGYDVGMGGSITMAEFTITELPAEGARVAVGCFSLGFGPSGDLEQYLLGFPSLATYWTNLGPAGGYGEGESSTESSFTVGDVIGVIMDGPNSTAHFYKNGFSTGIARAIGNTSDVLLFVSVEPIT